VRIDHVLPLVFSASLIPPLLLRLYEQAVQQGSRDHQRCCLDRWGALLGAGVGGVGDLLAALDRDV
jgi:hypothetical protein